MGPRVELDTARKRWREKGRALGLPDADDPQRAPKGLPSRVVELSTRIVTLPGDPFDTRLSFDDGFRAWWERDRPAPFEVRIGWNHHVPTLDAAVWVERGSQGWNSYLALHRHGGIEIGSNDTYTLRSGSRAFRLIRIVGLLWLGFDRQAWALSQVDATGPWQVTILLLRTEGALLGDLAEGWREPTHATYAPCKRDT